MGNRSSTTRGGECALESIVEGMGPAGSPADASAVHALVEALDHWCGPFRLRCSPPFLVGWYNDERQRSAGGASKIEAKNNVVALALYSVPGYLDIVADHYARERPASDFVDAATNKILDDLRTLLPERLGAIVFNTDEGPPYYHVQTVGAVAGVDQHIEAKDFDDKDWAEELGDRLDDMRDAAMWGTDPQTRRKIFGVNMHPTYGGWYAYRALIVLHGVAADGLQKPEPLRFLEVEDARRIITEYNLRHADCIWRELSLEQNGHPAEHKYSPEEYMFFMETAPSKRKKFLDLKVKH